MRRTLRHREYAAAVLAELAARQGEAFPGRRLVSIYFGGGTPSLWEPGRVGEVVAAVEAAAQEHGALPGGAAALEITLEANPDDLPRPVLSSLRAAGINRLSLGAQSMDPVRLAELGRAHGPGQTQAAVADARAVGFDNLSLDLIYGLPGQGAAELDRDLEALVALAPEHLSAYQLTVEERTPFGARARAGGLVLPDADVQADRFAQVRARLGAAGLEHYEISSFARPGREAVHNRLYWSGGEWLGLGPAAHSFRYTGGGGGERSESPRHIDRYIARWTGVARPGQARLAAEPPARQLLDEDQLAREAVWLGLRQLGQGLDRAAFAARFGADPVARFAARWPALEAAGLVTIDPERVRLSERGALLADEIALRFV